MLLGQQEMLLSVLYPRVPKWQLLGLYQSYATGCNTGRCIKSHLSSTLAQSKIRLREGQLWVYFTDTRLVMLKLSSLEIQAKQ